MILHHIHSLIIIWVVLPSIHLIFFEWNLNTRFISPVFDSRPSCRPWFPFSPSGMSTASSWDEESEPAIVWTIHASETPWFNVDEHSIVRGTALQETLDAFEEACDDDTPLRFRRFMAKAIENLRQSLAYNVENEFLLSDVPGTARPDLVGYERGFPCQAPTNAIHSFRNAGNAINSFRRFNVISNYTVTRLRLVGHQHRCWVETCNYVTVATRLNNFELEQNTFTRSQP